MAYTQLAFAGTPTPGQTTTVAVNGQAYSYTHKVSDTLANIVAALVQAIVVALDASQPGHPNEPYSCGVPASGNALRVLSVNPNFTPVVSGSTTDPNLTLTATAG